MKIKKNLIKRNIAGDVILVPVGSASLDIKGLISLMKRRRLFGTRFPKRRTKPILSKPLPTFMMWTPPLPRVTLALFLKSCANLI